MDSFLASAPFAVGQSVFRPTDLYRAWLRAVTCLCLGRAEEKQAPFWLYLVSVRVTYCVKVPDSLEREPLPEAHPALLSHRRGPAGSLIYMSQPHKSPSSGATKLLQGLSREGRFRRRLTDMEPCPGMAATHPP